MLNHDAIITSGKSLDGEQIGFVAQGLVVENITNQWYYEPARRRFIPPYQSGVTIPLGGSQTATLRCIPPGHIAQAAPIVGEYVSCTWTSDPIPAGGGINVGSFTAPPPVVVTDFAQGTIPAPPGVGATRVWADVLGELHRLLSTGADATLLDSSMLGIALNATLPLTLNTVGGSPAGNTTLVNASQWYDLGISFGLVAGTYLCIAYALVQGGAGGAGTGQLRISNNADTIIVGGSQISLAASAVGGMAIAKLVALTADTYRFEAQETGVTGAIAYGGIYSGLSFVRVS